MNFLLHNKIVVLLIGLGIAGIAWFAMTSSGPSPLLTTEVVGGGPDRELVETLLALRSVKLDGTIFSEPAFTQLQDFSQPIIQEPTGRENPFAPLDSASAVPPSSNAAAAAATTPPPPPAAPEKKASRRK